VTRLLLDNFTPERVKEALRTLRRRTLPVPVEIEVSGGITLENLAAYALPGVDYISTGSLTHSAPALDIGLDLEPGEA
jgi:nicotinate-nucleotide pyrophosphorylase (carboxylating)